MPRSRSPRDPHDLRLDDVKASLGLDSYERGKSFEEEVAELFSLLGYRTLVGYKRNDMQFDIRLELNAGIMSFHVLVECKNTGRPVTQLDVNTLGVKVFGARAADKVTYQAILVSANGFAENAHAAAAEHGIVLQTYEGLVRSLVDLGPNLDAAIRSFQGTPLERLYVELEVALERDIQARKSLTEEVLRWLQEPSGRFLALLGDFGCGKTSFTKRLACELALRIREELSQGASGTRTPVLINLKDGGSTTVTLENLLTHHFQRLSAQPFNPRSLLRLNEEGHLLLIFDAFDETIAYAEPGRYLENLRQLLRAAEGNAKVLLTCRSHYFRNRPEALRGLTSAAGGLSTDAATRLYEELQGRSDSEVGYMLEFGETQIKEYLSKAFPPPEDWQVFYEQIRHTYNLENLAERPFLLEIIVKTLPRLLEKGAVTLADLYESYCELWFDHTESRLTSLIRDRNVAMALVDYLARQVWDSPESRVHYTLLFERAAEYFKDRSLSFHDKERIDYEVRTALFLNRDAVGYYSFIHRSFLEFFIARTLRAGLAAGDAGCLSLRRITREVVFFLEFWPEAKKIPEFTGQVLAGAYRPRVSENALLLLYFHARASFGPLVGPQAVIEPNIAQIRRAFFRMRPKAIQLPGADLEDVALPGIDLGSAELEGVRLGRANLRQASLEGAHLGQADLRFVDFRKGTADGADLSDTKLDHLNAQEASFRTADLRGADLSFAKLARAEFQDADWKDVQTVGTGFFRAQGIDFVALDTTAGGPQSRALNLLWLREHRGPVTSIAWSPNGRCLASSTSDGSVQIWDASTGRQLNSLSGHHNSAFSLSWSSDGLRLASGSDDQTVKVWEASSGRLLHSLGDQDRVRSVSWSPDGTRIASASSASVKVWEASSGALLNSFGHRTRVRSVSWSPDGARIVTASSDSVKVWEASSGTVLNSLSGHAGSVLAVGWSPDGTRIASSSSDQTVKVWEVSSGRLLNSLGHDRSVNSVSWSPDSMRLASGSYDKTVKVWEASNGQLLHSISHDSSVLSISWSPDGMRLASSSDDKSVRVWEASSGRLLNSFPTREGTERMRSVTWSPDGTRLASSSSDYTVKVWEESNGRLLNSFYGHKYSVRCVSWSPAETQIASGSSDRTVKVWEATSGRLLNSLHGHKGWVDSVCWSPDGTRIASGSKDKTVKVWEAASGELLSSLSHNNSVFSVCWSPGGTQLASGSSDNTAKVWDTASGRLLNLFSHDGPVFSVCWSPDGTRLASGSGDKTVKVWEASSGRLLDSLSHDQFVSAVSWSPDGMRIASGSNDETVKVWEASSGRLLNSLSGYEYFANSISWSPDGKRLAISFQSGFLEIWNLAAATPLLLARFYNLSGGSGFAATPDGYVSGSPEALATVRFQDGWALYDVTDVPERVSPERVAAALRRSGG
jgi:WD40 repeat protein